MENLSERTIIRSLIGEYGSERLIKYYATQIRKELSKANTAADTNNSLGIARSLSALTTMSDNLCNILDEIAKSDTTNTKK